jgi:hypothetical protein
VLYPALVVVALSLFALIPLLQAHFFASSDGLYHIYRSIEIGQCLEQGAWLCRWAPTQFLGYGTPLFNYYSPFIYYITNVFHALGLGWVHATAAMTALFLLFSAVSAYLYAAEWLSRRAAVVAAVAYVYVPYHLVNAYYRGDLPEFAAMAWIPAILWSFSKAARPLRDRRSLVWVAAAALSYAGLVISHNLSAFIYTGVLVVYCIWLLVVNRLEGNYLSLGALFGPASRLVGATALAFGLSAFLALPALMEQRLVTLEGLLYVSHTDHFPTLAQILPNSIVHAYGIIFPDSPVYAYKMGLVQVGLGGLGVLAALGLWRRFGWRARGEAVISLALFSLAFFFAQPPSLPLWNTIPLLPHAQFPWRFLLLMALPTSLMVGYLVDAGGPRWRRTIAPPLIVFVVLTNVLGLRPIMANAGDGEIDLQSSTEFELLYHLMGTTVAGEYIPRTVKDRPFVNPTALAWTLGGVTAPAVHPTASDPNLQVELFERDATHLVYRVRANGPGRAVFNLAYFPDWQATLDGQPVDAGPNEPQGLMTVQIPAGEHTVRLWFENTPVRTWAERLSLLALFGTLALLAFALWRPSQVRRAVSESPVPSTMPVGLPRIMGGSDKRPLRQSLPRTLLCASPFIATAIVLPLGVRAFADSYRPPSFGQRPIKIDLGTTMQLLGYDLGANGQPLAPRQSVLPGSQLDLNVYWRPLDSSDQSVDSSVYARLTNIDEQQWSQAVEVSREPLPDGSSFRSQIQLPIPGAQPPGLYQIDIGAQERNGRPLAVKNMEMVELLPTQGSVRLGPLRVAAARDDAAQLRLAASANFESALRLESYEVSRGVNEQRLFPVPAEIGEGGALRATAGDTIQLDFIWRALKARLPRLLISASLVDERGFKWAVRDAEPVDGMFPTWIWTAGQQVRDQLRMPVPPETPPGRYRLVLRVVQDDRPLSKLGADGNPTGGHAELVDIDLARSEDQVREHELKGVSVREHIPVNADLEIVAADYGRTELRPGESSDVTLVWHAQRDVERDYRVRLSLIGPKGAIVGQVESLAVAGEQNPTSRWERDAYFRGQYRLTAASTARPGPAQWQVQLVDPRSGRAVATSSRLAEVRVLDRAVGQGSASARYPLNQLFGPAIRLIGFDAEPDLGGGAMLKAGDSMTVKLLWQAESEPSKAYTVFVQLLDSDGKLVAQHDGPPAGGLSPSSGWLTGDRIPDEHRVDLPKDLPAGAYRLIAGLYDASGERLTLQDGQTFAIIAPVEVR